MNRNEGAYQLSHVYDNLLFSVSTFCGEQQTAVRGRQQLLLKHYQKFNELFMVVLVVNCLILIFNSCHYFGTVRLTASLR